MHVGVGAGCGEFLFEDAVEETGELEMKLFRAFAAFLSLRPAWREEKERY